MHDIVEFETRGVPGVVVASVAFVHAAEAQADALGLAVARVFVPHPIQDRTDDELRTMADAVVAEVLGHLAGAE